MDERRTDTVQYGHLGTATYLPELRSWHFTRSPARSSPISYTGVARTTVPPSLKYPPQNAEEDGNWSKSLLKTYPEFAVGLSFEKTEALSLAITTLTDVCDPSISTLFDLGHAIDVDSHASGGRTVPIAAVTCGDSGSSFALLGIEDEEVDWKEGEERIARVPSIGSIETALWVGHGAPVRQIRFARPVEERGTSLAVRSSHATIVFRPLYRRHPVAASANSRFDTNQIAEIPNSQTGGYAHADVTFNPWYQKQLGIVDERGNWSIWNVPAKSRHRREGAVADCVKSGLLPWTDSDENNHLGDRSRYDGWAAIEWVGDVNKLIVCDRRCIVIYSTGDDLIRPRPVELGLARKTEWILDIQRSPSNASHVFILTTLRMFYVDVDFNAIAVGERNAELALSPRLYLNHYRDDGDTTLHLATLSLGDDLFLALYSRLNNLALCYQFLHRPEEMLASISDPFILQIPETSSRRSNPACSQDVFLISSLFFKQVEQATPRRKYSHAPLSQPMKLFVLYTDLAVREYLYEGSPEGGTELTHDVLSLNRRSSKWRKSSRTIIEDDDFIVQDWGELKYSLPTLGSAKVLSISPTASPSRRWTVDFTAIYSIAAGKRPMPVRSNALEPPCQKPFCDCLTDIEKKILNPDPGISVKSYQTWLEFLACSPFLNDIEQNALAFESLKLKLGRDSNPKTVCQQYAIPESNYELTSERNSNGSKLDDIKVLRLYDQLVIGWVSTLPPNTSNRVRLTKEKIIRNVAAELCLARIGLVWAPDATTDEPSQDGADKAKISQPPDSRQVNRMNYDVQSLLLSDIPLDNTSITPAKMTTYRKNPATTPQQQEDNVDPLFSSLRPSYKEQGTLPDSVCRIISHWTPGCDPALYDWQETLREQENIPSGNDSSLPAPRRRIRKRLWQNSSQETSLAIGTSPVVPTVQRWASQPQSEGLDTEIRSGQAVQENMPMSQVERGIFGSRRYDSTKTKKKKRAAGF